MSFTMEKSNGFRQWKKERDDRIKKLQEEGDLRSPEEA
jgi:hypothetical protein